MADPPPTRARIEAWDQTAAGLATAAGEWRYRADQLELAADLYLRHSATPGGSAWAGRAARSAAADAGIARTTIYRDTEHARRLAEFADRAAAGLRWGRQRSLAAIAAAEHDGFAVTDDLSIAEHRWCTADVDGTRLRSARAHREQIVHSATSLQSEDDRIAAQLRAGLAAFTGGRPVDQFAADQRPTIPAAQTSSADVHAWWVSLTPQQRMLLVAEHPPELGNLNGIPAETRNRVNLAVMQDDISRVENGSRSITESDTVRYRNATRTRAGLESARQDHCQALLWAYEPAAFRGKGRAAISIGDPDEAQDISIVVPGVGSSVAKGWLAEHRDAVNLYQQSRIADPNRSTAVIAWMGYDAPDGFLDTRLTEPGAARDGGQVLARDVNGLWTTHQGQTPQHVTVIGHSYGATTVSDAFAHSRMHANDAILLGCPGTDIARNILDFRLDGGRLYVGAASTDPVSWIGQSDGIAGELVKSRIRQHGIPLPFDAGLGRDPAGQGYGAVRFHAEVPGAQLPSLTDHVRYYQLGSEALRSMTDIVTGHAERLMTDGLLAEGRRQPHVGVPSSVQLPGLPPIPLPHVDMRIPGIPAYIDPEGDRHQVRADHAYS